MTGTGSADLSGLRIDRETPRDDGGRGRRRLLATFSELAFRFQVTPGMMLAGLAFSAAMGLIGGFFPARRAATMPIVEALRQA